jgi:diguanylate cyclase (GGDEF)-like protein
VTSPPGPARELSNSLIGAVLAYVRQAGGPSVEEVLEEAGDSRPLTELEDASNWSSYEQTRRIFAAAARLYDDQGIGRSVGEGLFSRYSSSQVVELLRSMESPGEVLRLVADVATKQSTVTTMTCAEAGDRHAVVTARTKPTIKRERLFCDYTAGVLASVPTIFGMELAEVSETECQTQGDPMCRYSIGWDPTTSDDLESQVRFLRAQVGALTTRFESLEQMASDLASVGDVGQALQMVIERAGVAIRAPQFVLAVRLPRESRLRIHHVGLDDEEAREVSSEILSDPVDDRGGSRLVVDVSSSSHRYGRIAALYPQSYRFLPEERKLFMAYAGHAAAALDTAAALDDARERARTIGALFDLATALSEVTTIEAVSERLARSILEVAECKKVAVFVFEPKDAIFTCRGRAGDQATGKGDGGFTPTRMAVDHSLLTRMTGRPEPMGFGSADGEGLDEVSKVAGFETGIAVPIVGRGRLLGMVAVDSDPDALDEDSRARERSRLDGIARIAASAFDNARLLGEARHQAGHDPLTDLPNSRLLEEMVTKALANSRRDGSSVALVFIDLDHFKKVNDELGHHAGDAVLAEASVRLKSTLRAGDTVGRLGGDEFAVLMPSVTRRDLETVVRRVLDTIERPIVVAGTSVEISASVGAAFADRSDDFDSLLRRADNAMYQAKSEGRARVCFAL